MAEEERAEARRRRRRVAEDTTNEYENKKTDAHLYVYLRG